MALAQAKYSDPEFTFSIKSIAFDEDYAPAATTRATTNFANLARGAHRQDNLRKALRMIDNRFNALAHWDNPRADRYALGIEIISVDMHIDGMEAPSFPLIETLNTTIFDHKTGRSIAGMTGNSFSSYVRDYDFSVVLRQHDSKVTGRTAPAGFGRLHGQLFQHMLHSAAYRTQFKKPPVICLSASSSRTYRQTGNRHPVLGLEYEQEAPSLTDDYFALMGCKVRFFMPDGAVAPLAFYATSDLLADYTDLELISAISTMESFQRIYRPEIYNANARAAAVYRPSLQHQDFSLTQIVYDREERAQLALRQGAFTQTHFIEPYHAILKKWSANFSA